jgi:hypothetical protein
VVTPDFAKRAGCTPWGQLTGFRMMGDKVQTPQCNGLGFELSGLTLEVPAAAVLDPTVFLAKGAEPLDGILGLDAFAGRALTIDFKRNEVTVESPASLAARTRGLREIRARISREVMGAALAVLVAVPTSQGTAWFELDSGNGGTILVSQHLAPLFGLDPKSEKSQPVKFTLAEGVAVEGNAFTPPMIIDGNLGMPFLARWILTMDLASGRVWLAPEPDPVYIPPPPPKE